MLPRVPTDEEVARWAAEKLADSRLMSLPRDLMGVVMLHVNEMHKQSDRYKDMCALWDKMEKDNNLEVLICNRCGAHGVSYEAVMAEHTREMDWCSVQSCSAYMCLGCRNKVCAYCAGTYCDVHTAQMRTHACNHIVCSEHGSECVLCDVPAQVDDGWGRNVYAPRRDDGWGTAAYERSDVLRPGRDYDPDDDRHVLHYERYTPPVREVRRSTVHKSDKPPAKYIPPNKRK
jgi:hypothetical protein